MSLRGTWLGLGVLVATGGAIMHISYAAQDLEARLQHLNAAIEKERQRIHVLEAEWAYLSRPERVQRLTEAHLLLEPTEPERLARFTDVPIAANGGGGQRPANPLDRSTAPRPYPRPAVPAPNFDVPEPEAPSNAPEESGEDLLRAAEHAGSVPDDLVRNAVQRGSAVGEAP